MSASGNRRAHPEPQVPESLLISDVLPKGHSIRILTDAGERLVFTPVWGGWGAFYLKRNRAWVLNQPSGRRRMYLLSQKTITTGETLTYSAMSESETVRVSRLTIVAKPDDYK